MCQICQLLSILSIDITSWIHFSPWHCFSLEQADRPSATRRLISGCLAMKMEREVKQKRRQSCEDAATEVARSRCLIPPSSWPSRGLAASSQRRQSLRPLVTKPHSISSAAARQNKRADLCSQPVQILLAGAFWAFVLIVNTAPFRSASSGGFSLVVHKWRRFSRPRRVNIRCVTPGVTPVTPGGDDSQVSELTAKLCTVTRKEEK